MKRKLSKAAALKASMKLSATNESHWGLVKPTTGKIAIGETFAFQSEGRMAELVHFSGKFAFHRRRNTFAGFKMEIHI